MNNLKKQHIQLYLPIAIQLVLGHKPTQKFNKPQKILITKLIKNLNILSKMNKKQTIQFIKNTPAYQPALAELYFDKTINNWRLITNDNPPPQEAIFLMKESNECLGVDYRIQFTLSTINKKKVMKPAILLIFQLRSGKFKLYLTVEKFYQLRYQVAEALKSVYSIQMRTFFG